MNAPVLHIVFDFTAAKNLQKALTDAGKDDRVVGLYGDMGIGPVGSDSAQMRAEWIKSELGGLGFDIDAAVDRGAAIDEAFWESSLAHDRRLIAWFSRRVAQQFAGFLEWLWRLGNTPCEIVDTTDVVFKSGYADLSFLSAPDILEMALIDLARPLGSGERAGYQKTWQRLKSEDALLRVIGADGLQSAPLSFFDSLILSCVTRSWSKTARVVGQTFQHLFDTGLRQTGDVILFSRLRALAEAGLVDAKGDLNHIIGCEVRLAIPAVSGAREQREPAQSN